MRVVSLCQPAATLTVTRGPCDCVFDGDDLEDPLGAHHHRCTYRQMVSCWVVSDFACPSGVVGSRIAIAATDDAPTEGERVGDWTVTRGMDGWFMRPCEPWKAASEGLFVPLPLGVVVGSAIVEASYPIVNERVGMHMRAAHVLADGRSLYLYETATSPFSPDPVNISDQLPYSDWLPGRFAWHLTDAEALPEPIPWVSSGGRLPEWQPT